MLGNNNISKYDRVKGVPQNHYMLMKIDCFGDFGIPYEDRILYHSSSEEALIDFCKDQSIELENPFGWNDYFIKRND